MGGVGSLRRTDCDHFPIHVRGATLEPFHGLLVPVVAVVVLVVAVVLVAAFVGVGLRFPFRIMVIGVIVDRPAVVLSIK